VLTTAVGEQARPINGSTHIATTDTHLPSSWAGARARAWGALLGAMQRVWGRGAAVHVRVLQAAAAARHSSCAGRGGQSPGRETAGGA
jgi:hypothetical protein